MNLLQIFTDCALDVYLLVAKTLRGDVKDFCWILTFSDWAKIRKFVNFGGLRVSQNVHISMYLASVHVDLVSVQFTVSGHGTSVKKQSRLLTVGEQITQQNLMQFQSSNILSMKYYKSNIKHKIYKQFQ